MTTATAGQWQDAKDEDHEVNNHNMDCDRGMDWDERERMAAKANRSNTHKTDSEHHPGWHPPGQHTQDGEAASSNPTLHFARVFFSTCASPSRILCGGGCFFK